MPTAAPVYSNVYLLLPTTDSSNYNALQVTITQRITHHISARRTYLEPYPD